MLLAFGQAIGAFGDLDQADAIDDGDRASAGMDQATALESLRAMVTPDRRTASMVAKNVWVMENERPTRSATMSNQCASLSSSLELLLDTEVAAIWMLNTST